ncbi:MAG: tRNA uridine-5-carboxymethylaminomethyl(34) synthesis GTPase MnmE [Rikenellaceae bacterium]
MSLGSEIIVAPATLSGGAIAVIRLSGEGSVQLVSEMFRSRRGVDLCSAKGYTMHYGDIVDGEQIVDDVVLSLFLAPHSYTSEDSVEISCHGSRYIVDRIIDLSVRHGARLADPGEFTMRAFMSGRIDLSQAEAVADLIATTNESTHRMATMQLRGGYSTKLHQLRDELVRLCSLVELELDFSEEDVSFADRTQLRTLIVTIASAVDRLKRSFKLGNALKNGVRVAIVGSPNAGKSTLLNRLLGEDRAMVSSIAGTTRDTIEEVLNIGGIDYRFVDTAGLHDTADELEQMGIARSLAALRSAQIVLHVVDGSADMPLQPLQGVDVEDQRVVLVVNKCDLNMGLDIDASLIGGYDDVVHISAKGGEGVDELLSILGSSVDMSSLYAGDIVVSNARHYTHLSDASSALQRTLESMDNNLPTDLLAEDLRQTLHHIGRLTGEEITSQTLLKEIFSSFCIGK